MKRTSINYSNVMVLMKISSINKYTKFKIIVLNNKILFMLLKMKSWNQKLSYAIMCRNLTKKLKYQSKTAKLLSKKMFTKVKPSKKNMKNAFKNKKSDGTKYFGTFRIYKLDYKLCNLKMKS